MKLEKLNSVNAEALSNVEMKNAIGGQKTDKGIETPAGTVTLGGTTYNYTRDVEYENGGHHYYV